jgi:arylsulfatase A
MWAYGFDLEGFELKHPKGTENNYYYNPENLSERYNCVEADRPHMTSRYWNPCIWRNGKLLKTTFDDFGPDICTDFLTDFIDRHRTEPFFIYYPMILTHGPNVSTPDTEGVEKMTPGQKLKNNNKYFKDMVEYADKLVGRILDKLETLGLRDNTIIMFTGDNGTMHGMETETEDGTVVGGKGSTSNAGTHVPLIASWRGTGVTGKTCDDLVDFTDFLMTIAHAGGATLPTVKFDGSAVELDGHSFLPQICGEKGNPRKYIVGNREWVFCHWDKNPNSPMPNPKFPRARFARNKRFKLYDNGRLYDVENDELEQTIIPGNPEKSEAELARKELQKVLDSMYMKPDFYTQGGVTRENNLTGLGGKDAILEERRKLKE